MKRCWLFCVVLFVFQFSIISVYGDDFSVWQDSIFRSRQCHGDADGVKNGLYWVGTPDLQAIQALYGKLPVVWPDDGVLYNPNLDFDRNFVINDLDVVIVQTWYGKTNVPGDCGKKLELTEVSPLILMANTSYTIDWAWRIYTQYIPMPGDDDQPGTLSLYYSTNNGANWTFITNITSGSNYDWSVPSVDSNNCMLKIVDNLHTGLMDTTATFGIHTCPTLIGGDFNNDCYVNEKDLGIIAEYWVRVICTELDNNWCQGADFEQNGIVNFYDYATFSNNWRLCGNPYDANCTE